ncbi:MAG: ATP-binding protein [Arenicella sp.]
MFILLLALPVLWSYSKRFEIDKIRQTGSVQLNLYKSSAKDAAEKYRYLTELLKRNNDIKNALKWQTLTLRDISSNYLESIIDQTTIREIILLNSAGEVISGSNWLARYNLIGSNLSSRPYFQRPNQKPVKGIFNITANKQNPSYYISEPVYYDSEFVGNVVVRISLAPLQQSWQVTDANVIITDDSGIIFISSNINLLRKTLGVLSSSTINKINREWSINSPQLASAGVIRINANQDVILKLEADSDTNETVGESFLIQSAPLESLNAKIHYLSSINLAQKNAITNIIAIIMPVLFISILLLFLRERKLKITQKLAQRDELERQVDRRTLALKSAQQELIQSSKLAALGKMSAAIVHELNQPITAIRTLSSSLRLLVTKQHYEEAQTGLGKLVELTDYMSSITKQLKVFSRKPAEAEHYQRVSLTETINTSLKFFDNEFEQQKITLKRDYPDDKVLIAADHMKLEQVFINLISNSLDALKQQKNKTIRISIKQLEEKVCINFSDNGTGIDETDLPHLFDPFFTTKQVGDGLGLGLSISYGIINELKGTMSVTNNAYAGATFTVLIPQ